MMRRAGLLGQAMKGKRQQGKTKRRNRKNPARRPTTIKAMKMRPSMTLSLKTQAGQEGRRALTWIAYYALSHGLLLWTGSKTWDCSRKNRSTRQ